MTTFMITPYAPYRDGIANYAVQEVAALRRSGVEVRVLSPLPSAAHEHLVIGWPVGMLRLLARLLRPGADRVDRVVLQFYPELLFGSCRNRLDRLAVWWLLALLCRRVPVELRVHEIDYAAATADDATTAAARRALLAADAVTVHTEAERRRLVETFDLSPTDVRLADHGGNFARRTTVDRAEARDSLGIPADAFVFVSIGFIQRHKGFDRGARALDRIDGGPAGGIRLYVVGDIRVEHPEVVAYRDELRALVDGIDGAELRSGYVSDEEFDRWVVAADRLVLPYREIWSSSVMERAELYGVPVIATDVGGLADQAHPGSTIVADDEELAAAMAEACGGTVTETGVSADDEDLRDRADLQAAMARRAGTVEPGTRPETTGLGRVPRAAIDSARPGVPQIKRLISRVTSWQLEPVVAHVDDLTARASHDLSQLASRVDALERDA